MTRFLFGVATADHQCEAYEPAWEDERDRWDRDMRLVQRGRATDFWTRYLEDVQLASGLGCNAFRFSVAWARVEPQPGVFDAQALDHYRSVVDAIRDAGMEPVLTLVHYTWPLHVAERGGLLDAGFPDAMARYAAEVVRAMGDRVRYWITFNEPNELVYGYLKPWWTGEYRMPPGLPAGAGSREQMQAVIGLMRSLFVANARAREAIRAALPGAQVSTNPFLLGLPGWLQSLLDWRATRLRSEGAWEAAGSRAARQPIPALGRLDMVAAAVSATPQRGVALDFSRPYYVAGLQLLVPAGSAITGPASAAGAVVAVVRGSTAEAAATRVVPGATPLPVDDYAAGLAALDAGSAAALLADDTIGEALTARQPGRYALVGEPLSQERYVVAVAKGSRGLLQVVNDVLEDRPAPSVVEPGRDRCLRRIVRRGRLLAGVPADVPGLGYRDPVTGAWSGREVDLARAVAARVLGDPDRVELRPVTTRERLPAVRPWSWLLDPLLRWIDLLLCALNSNWWHLGMAGRLPEWLCPPECAHQQDFVGMDYYWGIPTLSLHRVHQLAAVSSGRFDQAPVWPAAFRRLLHYLARLFPDQPVMVLENGCVELADGFSRAEYLRQHWRQADLARRAGVPLIGYLAWSITSNREWGLQFGPASDFGLYRIQLDSDPALTRMRTESADAYQEIIESASS